jgi:hypothetical protein
MNRESMNKVKFDGAESRQSQEPDPSTTTTEETIEQYRQRIDEIWEKSEKARKEDEFKRRLKKRWYTTLT